MVESAVSGPLCGVALFLALTGGRLPHARPCARPRALTLRWLTLGVLAAFEEVVWRGLALSGLALALGTAAALALSSAGFAIWHAAELGRRCAIHLVTGLGFGGAFLVGGLGAAIVAHATYNVLVDWAVHAERTRS
jgi:membrane protease YdiL (CAAX protease family)